MILFDMKSNMVIWRPIVLHILSMHAVTSNIINILQRVLNVNLLNETPKQWQKYVNNVIYKTIYVYADNTGNTLTITSSMKILLEKSKSFISYSTKFCNEETMTKTVLLGKNSTAIPVHHRNFTDEIYGKAILYSANVSRASGNFFVVAPHLRKFDCQFKYLWIFQLFKKLRVNVTFHFIYFHGSSNNCQLGYINVEIKTLQNRSENNFLFCGQHSKFSIFPACRNLDIKLKTYEQIFFRQLFTHEVIDWKILSTYNSTDNISHIPEMVFFRENSTLQTFSIKVNHYEDILLEISTDLESTMFLLDGPGLVSPWKIIRKKITKLARFQCLVKIYKTLRASGSLQVIYTSVKSLSSTHIIPKESPLLYLNYNMLNNTNSIKRSVLNLETNDAFKINCTVMVLRYAGPLDSSCKYGGLVAYETQENVNKHVISLCNENISQFSQPRNIYSTFNKLVLVVYNYKEYSKLNVTVKITTSVCELVRIDICKIYSFWDDFDPLIGKYIADITKFSNLRLYLVENEFIERDFGHLTFSLENITCGVLQFTSNSGKYRDICDVHLKPKPITKSDKDLLYFMTGLFIYQNIEYDEYLSVSDYLQLYGEANDVCIFKAKDNIPYFSCNNYTSDSEDREMHISRQKPFTFLSLHDFKYGHMERQNFSKLGFFLSCKTISPTDIHSLKVVVNLKYASSSWVDIQIRWNMSKKKKDLQLLWYGLSDITENIIMPYHLLKKLSDSETHALVIQFHPNSDLKLETYSIFTIDVSICLDYYKVFEKNPFLWTDRSLLAVIYYPAVECSVNWKSTLLYSKLITSHMISFPGIVKKVNITDQYISANQHFTAFWPNLYDKYDQFLLSEGNDCESAKNAFQHDKCFNFSQLFEESDRYYIFLETSFDDSINPNASTYQTWNKALADCRSIGGELPYFNSRRDLEELMAFLKLNAAILPLKAIYIGISSNFNTKVSNSVISEYLESFINFLNYSIIKKLSIFFL